MDRTARGLYVTHSELIDLIDVANLEAGVTTDADGTFYLPTDVYDLDDIAVARAEAVSGYEVGYGTLIDLDVEVPRTFLALGDRFGRWTDPDTGIVHLDRTMRIVGPREIAATIAGTFDQQSFWGWAEHDCFAAERV